uniref:Uncharacterized protein n=1 Tax=Bombyx mori TaxID=7091 RepID=A0A8R2R3Y5_BOMMO|nr:uncharacterized protein LOC119629632 [Bombyx mori]
MSKRRLDWKESLKLDVTVGKKRGKINILNETYKNENGKLTLVSSIKTKKTSTQTNTINKNNTIQECTSTLRSEICTPEMSHVEEKFQFMNNDVVPTNNDTDTQKQDNENIEMTPRQLSRRLDVENLTPRFRKPDCFLAETKEVMKIITPVKLFPTPSKTHIKEAFKIIPPYDSEENEEIKHNFSNLNNITLALNEQNHEDNNGEGKFSLDLDSRQIHNEPRSENEASIQEVALTITS